ncbi:site-specific integrase [Candidatus Sulfidibacterium hydrothermale]|uniref:site-specific integrase n=1 Tax=Candidatus Sulfidibacterium hydrothermale TaxID=2875962 RepID=UPI001F0B629A|nr:site-specific integrase [Candidatus Sulfidibacterium hydrothermale]UBM62795.1 site-specific integrase [Candidatus Sulfidibacterium hydrothermale]
MATVIYFVRTSKKTDPTKKISVRVRFRHGKKINLYAKSGLEILPRHFSNETHTINKKTKYPDKNKDKQYLDNLEVAILDAYKDLKTLPTADWLNLVIDKYRFPDKYTEKPKTLFDFFQSVIDNAEHRINQKTDKQISYQSVREFHVTFGYLKEYARSRRKEIDFEDIDLDFYNDFIKFLEKKNLAQNTIGKKLRFLKIVLNEATDRGINTNMAFKSKRFKAITEESDNIYLSVQEIEQITKLDLSNKPYLDRTRDLFLIGCWTGLRFSDWNKVKPENIQNGFLTLKQQKTGQPVVIPIHPTVKTILDKYKGVLPKTISNQKFNEYIKQVAKMADFKEAVTKQITRGGKTETIIKNKWQLVTTHTARRSFATNMYKMGIPSITIMAITGHRTETAFLKYIKVTPQEHAERYNTPQKLDNELS